MLSVFRFLKNNMTLALVLMGLTMTNAQNLRFEHINDNNGLSHSAVRHIVQDDTGFLWLGTFSGLNRFDGYQFKSYLSSDSRANKIGNDDITDLELDQESNHLWIGTRNGLSLFELDKQIFTTFLPEKDNPSSLPDKEIRSVHVDKFKRVWVGTKTKGLYILDLRTQEFSQVAIDGFEYIKEIFEDTNGHIWVGTYGTGALAKISLSDDGKISKMEEYTLTIPGSTRINPYINFIYEDHKSDIFIGTRAGLYRLDRSANTFENLEITNVATRESLGPYFLSVARSPDGKYWVGTLGGLLVCNALEDIAKGDFEWHYTVLSDDTSLVDNLISALYFDPSGVLWIGTEDGLDKYDPYENQFNINKTISKYIGNQVPRIRGFSETFDKKLVVATRHNGLFILEENTFKPLFDKSFDIASIHSDNGKTFYCGLWDGSVLVYDYVKNSSRIVDVGFKNAAVLSFLDIGENRMIIGSFGEGAVVVNSQSLVTDPNTGHLFGTSSINEMDMTDDGNVIWIATEDGVLQYNSKSKKTKSYQSKLGDTSFLPHNNVSGVVVDDKGSVWAATRLGLARYDQNQDNFIALNKPKELDGKWVTDLLLDKTGKLWLNMNDKMVAKLDPKLQNIDLKVYEVNSGNRLEVFGASGFYHFNDSIIYLAGKNGVISFSPYTIEEDLWAPKPFISEFMVQNKEVYYGVEINDQYFSSKSLNFNKEITLDYKNRNFSIQFSSPSYLNQRQNKFEYKLEGFNDDWVMADVDSRTVQYTNLYPGKYTFKVRASNSNGYWSDEVAYTIEVKPPFWLTYKAFFLFLIVFLILIFVVHKVIKERIRLRQELLTEKLKQERNEKLNNEKLRFFTNISHELRTPLTLILGPAKDLIHQAAESRNEFLGSRSQLIHQNANRLLTLVNQVLDFRKAQTGELDLVVTHTDILERSRLIFDTFKDLAHNKNISYNFNCEDASIKGWIDTDKYEKILFNLLSNAIKFTNNHGEVDFYLGLGEDSREQLVIEVSDNGIGIPEASQKNIFSRFYQARNSKENTTGSGIGLSLVNSLVIRHKGEIKFTSNSEEGTIFIVKIPIARNAYEPKEISQHSVKIKVHENPPYELAKTNPKTLHIKHKIVIVEDNTELRNYLEDYLSDYYKIYVAENGKEGLQLCKQIKPALCVADVMMPIMDGLEFCKALKSDEIISHIPVILLTALSENDDKANGYNVGADGYLVKPFDPSLLKTRIANIINNRIELKAKFSGDVDSEVGLLTHSPIDEEFMIKVTALINENLKDSELTTSFLCQELGMSSSKLYRKIKELTDLAPNEFIRTVRLKKSAVLLKTKKYNVSEVSDLTGFNDPLYFSRCFKKQFGFPPSTLIKDELKTEV